MHEKVSFYRTCTRLQWAATVTSLIHAGCLLIVAPVSSRIRLSRASKGELAGLCPIVIEWLVPEAIATRVNQVLF